MKRYSAIFMFLIISASAFAQDRTDELTAQKRDDIKKLMEVTGATQIAGQMAESILQAFMQNLKQLRPDVPNQAVTVMNDELVALFKEKMEAPGGLVDLQIPIYNKYFTHSEIKGLLAFYQTDLGRKIVEVLPKVTSESMVTGQEWGKGLGPEIVQRLQSALKKQGIELPDK